MERKAPKIIIGIGIALIVFNGVWTLLNIKQTNADKQKSTDNSQAAYPLLSKRIFAENQNDMLLNFVPLRKDLDAAFKALPSGTLHSFYFEYLPSGTSIRNGSDNTLVAASLIKVPLVMNLFKAAELGKVNLDSKVTITDQQLDGAYGDLWKKGAGTEITLREAAKLALTESDNTAAHIVFDAVNGLLTSDQESLNNLDISQNMKEGQAVIDAKSYTSVLKSLFLASYVNRASSQEILSYMSQSTATNRITAQLPKDIPVAHKIGVYNSSWSESDCGIVYATKRPYAICIMVGLPEEQANIFIANISKKIYDFVVSQ